MKFSFFLLFCVSVTTISSLSINAGTWNLGLLSVAPDQQLDYIVSEIPKNLQVLSLQEVWTLENKARIIQKLYRHYAFSYSIPIPDVPEKTGCKQETIDDSNYSPRALIECLVQLNVSSENFKLIDPLATQQCWNLVLAIAFPPEIIPGAKNDEQCIACLQNEIPFSGFDLALELCSTNQGDKYYNGGDTGIVVLAKHPIKNPYVTYFESYLRQTVVLTFNVRRVMYATSHFPFDITGVPGIPTQALQPSILAFMRNTGADVLLGDFNSGPNYQSQAYNETVSEGWIDVNYGVPTFCTVDNYDPSLCSPSTAAQMIDHIFLSPERHWNSYKYFTFGRKLGLSDHIGIRAIACGRK
eukprot:TRINITY_DN2927_c0_g1_i2.p1 TRINITY_DN2927_c0_g1~~TRINITY_DN2927_c0_g1_i2.p1  ORF type:complete len:355 (-),score=38.10 TRINITY_DN2927_c0_g1_i2:49-1113(-)